MMFSVLGKDVPLLSYRRLAEGSKKQRSHAHHGHNDRFYLFQMAFLVASLRISIWIQDAKTCQRVLHIWRKHHASFWAWKNGHEKIMVELHAGGSDSESSRKYEQSHIIGIYLVTVHGAEVVHMIQSW